MNAVDELLYGEYDYYIMDSSEGKYLAVVSPLKNDLADLRDQLITLGLQFVGTRETCPEDWLKNIVTDAF